MTVRANTSSEQLDRIQERLLKIADKAGLTRTDEATATLVSAILSVEIMRELRALKLEVTVMKQEMAEMREEQMTSEDAQPVAKKVRMGNDTPPK
jgi:hypothetical protein